LQSVDAAVVAAVETAIHKAIVTSFEPANITTFVSAIKEPVDAAFYAALN